MSNIGLHRAMERRRHPVLQTRVGDRYVLEELGARNLSLGGEQSGPRDHGRLRDHRRRAADRPPPARGGRADRAAARGPRRRDRRSTRRCCSTCAASTGTRVHGDAELEARRRGGRGGARATTGRVLLRPSGTEPVVRVMVEAAQHLEAAEAVAASLADGRARAARARSRRPREPGRARAGSPPTRRRSGAAASLVLGLLVCLPRLIVAWLVLPPAFDVVLDRGDPAVRRRPARARGRGLPVRGAADRRGAGRSAIAGAVAVLVAADRGAARARRAPRRRSPTTAACSRRRPRSRTSTLYLLLGAMSQLGLMLGASARAPSAPSLITAPAVRPREAC